ncbi:MAG: flagellar hook-associated protein FlgL [Armatimonadetes bacterium]|nr:flagellar hook-associated protein FlgL [Armatimonadota bacterium]MBX3108194.1 flagellar hook-associated protein FlgL [Fimbriimonadaceae bacterium]
MRVSTPYQFETFSNSIRTAQEAYFRVQRQISTGKKFESASEDPLSTRLSINARTLKSRFEQFDKNLRGANDYLGFSENALADVTDVVNQANQLAIQGASSAIDVGAAQSLADQVGKLQERLVRLANTQGGQGQYIFAGQKNGTAPYSASGGVLTYSGDGNPIRAEIRSGEYMDINLAGIDTDFVDMYAKLEQLKTNLSNQDVVAISTQSLADIKGIRDKVTNLRAEVGSRLQTVQSLKDENTRRIDDFTKDISDYEDVDLSDAIVRYQQTQSAYQAAMQVASQGMNLSLMDFLR